ncbi:MAG: DNA primase [Bacilli bacterium]
MNQVAPDKIAEIRNSIDIVDIVSSYVALTQRGKNFFGVCPFHDDSNPSMSVAKDKQIYTCFSCGATGNVFNFISNYENISFMEALKKCADMANIPLDIKTKNNDNEKFNNLYQIYDISTKFYHNILKSVQGREAREYLNSRMISDEIINTFRIGLSLKDRSMLTKFLTKNDYTKKELLDSGLILDNEYGINDIYCNRIMFPLEDLSGRIVGFSGRIYNSVDNAKYINTRETDIFKKGETLYNYKRASKYARLTGSVIIMEGFMDVIRAYTVGIKNVIATMGTAVTSKHANIIKRMAKDIYVCFDGDQAGEKATNSIINELELVGVIPKIIRLEDDYDPDDYIKKFGVESFQAKLDNPMSVIEFKLNYLKKGFDLNNIEDKASYTRNVIDVLNRFDDDILREMALLSVSTETGLDVEFLRKRLKPLGNLVKAKTEEIKNPMPPQPIQRGLNKYQKAEINLIYYMLQSKEAILIYDRRITHMPTKGMRLLAREVSSFYHYNKYINIADFLSYAECSNELLEPLKKVLSQNLRDEVDINEIVDYINVIREYNINNEIKKLQIKISSETDTNKQRELVSKITDLIKEKVDL